MVKAVTVTCFLYDSPLTLTLLLADKMQEEEEERSDRWNSFLKDHAESGVSPANGSSEYNHQHPSECDKGKEEDLNKGAEGKDLHIENSGSDLTTGNVREGDEEPNGKKNVHRVQLWTKIRPSLQAIEDLMSVRVKTKENSNGEQEAQKSKSSPSIDEADSSKGVSENDSEDEFYGVERSDTVQDGTSVSSMSAGADANSLVSACPWKEELEVLVRGGAPMALRGEVINFFILHYCLLFSILCIILQLLIFSSLYPYLLLNNNLKVYMQIFSSGKHLWVLRNVGSRIITKIC